MRAYFALFAEHSLASPLVHAARRAPKPATLAPLGSPRRWPSAAQAVLPLFTAHVALWLVYGVQTGGLLAEAGTPLTRLDGAVFALAYVCVAVALWRAAAPAGRRAARVAARALAGVALSGAALGGASVVALGQPVGVVFPVATLALFAGALVAGAARWAGGDRFTGVALVGFGATTLPLAIALPALVGGALPAYAVYEAHFLVAGAWWAAVAARPSR